MYTPFLNTAVEVTDLNLNTPLLKYGTEINNKENKATIQAIKRETTNALHTRCIFLVLNARGHKCATHNI